MPRRPARLLEVEQAALASHVTPVVCCDVVPLFVSLGTLECWGGRQEECGPELCVRQLRVCGSQLAVCLVSLFVSVCRSCVSSSSVPRPPITRWCPVRERQGLARPPLWAIPLSKVRVTAKDTLDYTFQRYNIITFLRCIFEVYLRVYLRVYLSAGRPTTSCRGRRWPGPTSAGTGLAWAHPQGPQR